MTSQAMPSGIGVTEADEILSISEVAGYLRCSKAHVYNAINGRVDGVSQLPAIHMGRRRLVRRSSLESWKRQNERGGLFDASDDVGAGVEPGHEH